MSYRTYLFSSYIPARSFFHLAHASSRAFLFAFQASNCF